MAHLIDFTTGTAAIAYSGVTPWHGLGHNLTPDAPLDTWVKEAGLDWTALKTPVQFTLPDGNLSTVDDKAVIFRSDTNTHLGVVGDGYQVVQPSEVVQFFSDLTDEYGFRLEVAGALKSGRIVWALANVPDKHMRIMGTDVVKPYVLLSTSFDGSRATEARFTTVRVVCNNTLHLSDTMGTPDFRISHRSVFKHDEAKKSLMLGAFAKFEDTANMMAEFQIDEKESAKIILDVYHDMTVSEFDNASNTVQNNVNKTLSRLGSILKNAPGQNLRSTTNTLWGLVNAVTHDIDFQKKEKSNDSRFYKAQFGQGASTKTKIFDTAVQYLRAA